jgi:hypothetical protein
VLERALPKAPPEPTAVLGLRGRVGPGGPALSLADPGPVAAAVAFLVSCQGEDGLVSPARSALPEDARPEPGHDLAVTGFVVLALLDAVEPEGGTPGARAAGRGLDALARAVPPLASRRETADLEGVVLATWALAAGYGRTARATWGAALPAGVARVVAAASPDGGWRAPGGSLEDHLLLTVEALALLGEVAPLRTTFPVPPDLDGAREAAAEWALSVRDSDDAPRAGPGVLALEVLLRVGGASYDRAAGAGPDLVTGPPPDLALDHASVLLGSVLRFPPGGALARAWNRDVLAPAASTQRAAPPAAGSFDPRDARSRRYGRAYATALETLAWLFPRVPFREPRGT